VGVHGGFTVAVTENHYKESISHTVQSEQGRREACAWTAKSKNCNIFQRQHPCAEALLHQRSGATPTCWVWVKCVSASARQCVSRVGKMRQ
jgi:hypothetical protein